MQVPAHEENKVFKFLNYSIFKEFLRRFTHMEPGLQPKTPSINYKNSGCLNLPCKYGCIIHFQTHPLRAYHHKTLHLHLHQHWAKIRTWRSNHQCCLCLRFFKWKKTLTHHKKYRCKKRNILLQNGENLEDYFGIGEWGAKTITSKHELINLL